LFVRKIIFYICSTTPNRMNNASNILHPYSAPRTGAYINSFAASFAAGSREKQKRAAGFGVVTNRLPFFCAYNIAAKVSQLKPKCQFFSTCALAPANLVLGWPFLCHQTNPNMAPSLLIPAAPRHQTQELSALQVGQHFGQPLFTVTAIKPAPRKVLMFTHVNLRDALFFLETLEANEQGGAAYE